MRAPSAPSRGPAGARLLALVLLPTTGTTRILGQTVGFVKKLATSRAVALGLEPSEEIRRWYAAIPSCIQRSNAKVLRGEPVHGRPTPPPSRFTAMGRDLSFAA